eukprot:CAMPEP_0204368830 /NCGR_PEP_ID=MMETSP0469-20131031/44503_1 /ASSEMBLY_ACC=CAM_ASM_000384 /TAXON_ID=2969 /ORGANISM="Oxyrrhis marina" /LENGTH=300 /DNA_ID=CAMNT_0051358455 /DNA_START=1 /DNA_END=900 /DNA_ORIENTATION=+
MRTLLLLLLQAAAYYDSAEACSHAEADETILLHLRRRIDHAVAPARGVPHSPAGAAPYGNHASRGTGVAGVTASDPVRETGAGAEPKERGAVQHDAGGAGGTPREPERVEGAAGTDQVAVGVTVARASAGTVQQRSGAPPTATEAKAAAQPKAAQPTAPGVDNRAAPRDPTQNVRETGQDVARRHERGAAPMTGGRGAAREADRGAPQPEGQAAPAPETEHKDAAQDGHRPAGARDGPNTAQQRAPVTDGRGATGDGPRAAWQHQAEEGRGAVARGLELVVTAVRAPQMGIMVVVCGCVV